jgi:hypothetical protein
MSEEALRKASDKQFYGRLGPASPVKRIDPKTGEVVEIISGGCTPGATRVGSYLTQRIANGAFPRSRPTSSTVCI